jgi:hypothetical protein
MSGSHTVGPEAAQESVDRRRIWREGTTMVLYVSVVLLATLEVLPAGHTAGEPIRGPVGAELVALLWGTTIGLAVLHWFAFRVAALGFGEGVLHGQEFKEAMAQLAGAAVVAAATTVPVVLFPPEQEQRAVLFLLALIIGGVGYLVERAAGRPRMTSAIFGGVTLMVALVAVTAKIVFSPH